MRYFVADRYRIRRITEAQNGQQNDVLEFAEVDRISHSI